MFPIHACVCIYKYTDCNGTLKWNILWLMFMACLVSFLTACGLLHMLGNMSVEGNKIYISQLKRLKGGWWVASFCLLFKSTVLRKGILSQLNNHRFINLFQASSLINLHAESNGEVSGAALPCHNFAWVAVPSCPWDLWEWSYQPGTK